MRVRRLTAADDLAPAIALLQRFFREEDFDTPDASIAANTRRLAALDTCGLFLVEDEGRALGVATVSMEFGIEYGWWAEMGDLYVLPEARGQGAARTLVDAVEAFLRDKGASGYQVTVTPGAEAHHGLGRFYGRLGFGDEGRIIRVRRL